MDTTKHGNRTLHYFDYAGSGTSIDPDIFTHLGKDIFLIDTRHNILKLNSKTKNIEKATWEGSIGDLNLVLWNGVIVNPPQYYSRYGDLLLFPVYKLAPRNIAGYYDSLYFVELNLSSLEQELVSFKMPAEFENNKWPIHDSFSVVKMNENEYCIAFEAFADVFTEARNGELKRYEINLEAYDLNNKVESFPNLNDQYGALLDRKYAYGSQKFFPLKYNRRK